MSPGRIARADCRYWVREKGRPGEGRMHVIPMTKWRCPRCGAEWWMEDWSPKNDCWRCAMKEERRTSC